jgi:hypothetical protein
MCIAAALSLVAGCATTKQARNVETSGFLGDYSKLHQGAKGEALLVYRNPSADFSKYDKVLLEYVTIWKSPDSSLEKVPHAELRRLSLDLYSQVKRKLEEDYELVDQPGPGVMRLRLALTEAGKSNVALDIFSTIVPQARILSAGKSMATGTESFVGGAAGEAELTDADTGEILFAAVDRRAGGKSFKGSSDPWSDVHYSFAYWAHRIRDRLREERAAGAEGA